MWETKQVQRRNGERCELEGSKLIDGKRGAECVVEDKACRQAGRIVGRVGNGNGNGAMYSRACEREWVKANDTERRETATTEEGIWMGWDGIGWNQEKRSCRMIAMVVIMLKVRGEIGRK